MQITKVAPSTKKGMFDIYVDAKLFATVTQQTVLDCRSIKVGNRIEERDLSEILTTAERDNAYREALVYISKSMRTVRQIRDKLLGTGYCEAAVDEAVDRLVRYGYVDDIDYAMRYIDRYKAEKGKIRLRYEMRLKGVPDDIISRALLDIDEYDPAYAEAVRYSRRKGYDRVRLYRHLSVRGYSADVISQVIDSITDGGLI